ncbi:MAG TPA: YwbE family protein [Anaerolineales bacterium]|nr:YwbE family protein [Anaerolineales bacterium]
MSGDPRKRASIRPGMTVLVVLKQDQGTGKLTRGIVKDILTPSANHPRGIKVRLQNGLVGRVQQIPDPDSETSPH